MTVYDTLFISLAKKTGSYLMSLDDDQTKIAAKLGVKIIEL